MSASSIFKGQPNARGVLGVSVDTATATDQREFGIGALMPWAGYLWFTTYPDAAASGEQNTGLWRIGPDMKPELVEAMSNCHAGRFIHHPTMQAFIGPWVIDRDGNVRTITVASGPLDPTIHRISGWCADPDTVGHPNRLYALTMDGFLGAVDGTTLASVFKIDIKVAAGITGQCHLKAIWRGQTGVVVAANMHNGMGRLLHYDGLGSATANLTVLDPGNNSWIEVAGCYDNMDANTGTIWAFGHDHKSCLMWQLGTNGNTVLKKYRLPFGHQQQIHGFQQEWMRLRAISTERFHMYLHGQFYMLSPVLTGPNDPTSPLSVPMMEPISRYNRTYVDWCDYNGFLVLATNDQSMQGLNYPSAGDATSALVFTTHDDLWQMGKPGGTGHLLKNASLAAGASSDMMLMRGFDKKSLHLANATASPVDVDVKTYNGATAYTYATITVPAGGYVHHEFPDGYGADWVAVSPKTAVTDLTAWVVYA